jgi:hypothetical protein
VRNGAARTLIHRSSDLLANVNSTALQHPGSFAFARAETMNRTVLFHVCGVLLLTAQTTIAPAQNPGERRVRIEITRNENGTESHVTREFDLSDEQQLADALRELGVMDELNIIGDDENLVLDLRRMRDGGMLNDMSVALSMAEDAMAPSEPRAYLGVYYGNWNVSCDKEAKKNEPPVKEGACITAIEGGTPAEKAGLKEGDVIIAMDGEAIKSGEDLAEAIGDHKPGDEVKFTFYRGKEKKTANITLAAKKEDAPSFDWSWDQDESNGSYERALESMAEAFRADQRGAFLGVDGEDEPNEGGVRITNVVDSSAAERMGLKEGDVIRSINGETIGSFEDLADLMEDSEPNSDAQVRVERDKKEITFSGKLGQRQRMIWNWDADGPAPFQLFAPMAPLAPMPPMPQDMDPEDKAEYEQDMAEYRQDLAEHARDMAEHARDRDEHRREMDELRREMDRLRRDLRGEVTREMRVTVDAVKLSKEESDVLKNKGVTGLESTLELPGLRVSPNPSSGSFDLAFQVPERGDLNVDVHDANGDRVYHESITGFKGNYERVLDMSDRPNGTYFVVITQNGKAQARKLVKQ